MYGVAITMNPPGIKGKQLVALLGVLHNEKPGSKTLESTIRDLLNVSDHIKNPDYTFFTDIVAKFIIPKDSEYPTAHRLEKFLIAFLACQHKDTSFAYFSSATKQMVEDCNSDLNKLFTLICVNSDKNVRAIQLRVANMSAKIKSGATYELRPIASLILAEMDAIKRICKIFGVVHESPIGFKAGTSYDEVRQFFQSRNDHGDSRVQTMSFMTEICDPNLTNAARLTTFALAIKCEGQNPLKFQEERNIVLALLEKHGMFGLNPNVDNFVKAIQFNSTLDYSKFKPSDIDTLI